MTIGEKITLLRNSLGMSQEVLAKIIFLFKILKAQFR